MWGWGNALDRQPDHWTWEYDVERAKQLLAEAGYEDGFEITIANDIAEVAGEIAACQAVADMWADIGINRPLPGHPLRRPSRTVWEQDL